MRKIHELEIKEYIDCVIVRKVYELELEEYIDCVLASDSDGFEEYCKAHGIDYEDAMAHDWD